MPLTPDYQSAADAHAERPVVATSGSDRLTILAFLASGGIALKALLVSGGIQTDEVPTVVLMLAVASGLLAWSVVVNVRRRKIGGVVTNVLALFLLGAAFAFTAFGWRYLPR
jgi:hypothetical protein